MLYVPKCFTKIIGKGPSSLLNVAAYKKSNNTEACTKKLSQIFANNIDNLDINFP